MRTWRDDIRVCGCGDAYRPRREAQRHCSTKCGTRTRVTQHRTRYREPDPTTRYLRSRYRPPSLNLEA